MKASQFLQALLLATFALNAYAVTAPIYTSAEEIKLVLSDEDVMTKISDQTGDAITEIIATNEGYYLKAGKCQAIVEVSYPAVDEKKAAEGVNKPQVKLKTLICGVISAPEAEGL